ncbi:MAG: YhdH/YhfP family quinone oxidoreductase [Zetaproteobacteria bacterium]|nr:YhdH/YhfP family quinone oxidoreductase [Zetaproteobacteria bacterium]
MLDNLEFRVKGGQGQDVPVPCLQKVMVQHELGPGQVRIQIEYSSLNFKDALGVSGRGKIFRKWPIVPGIDCAGTVMEVHPQQDKALQAPLHVGQKVVVTGCGLGEEIDGGYQQIVDVPQSWAIPLTSEMTTREAMVYGTAGFTAALAMHRMQALGQEPSWGPILVTGATGGVGSFAVRLFSSQGYEVHAVTSKKEQHAYLKSLGAVRILSPEIFQSNKPLESQKWAGALDQLGGAALASILPRVHLWGNVASIGLALGPQVQTTVMPFILRGVSIIGISSTNCPIPLRHQIWQKVATDWKIEGLDELVHDEITLSSLIPACFESFFERKVTGRILVRNLED